MVKLTDEQKEYFYTPNHFKEYVLYFPEIDLTITNEELHEEALTIKESICESDELVLGGCIASSIEFEVSEIMAEEISGLEFSVTLRITDADDHVELTMPMGVCRASAVEQVDDKDYKKVTGYDALYDASVDVSEWYNDFFSDGNEHTIKEARESLLEYLGISYKKQTLANDSLRFTKTIETNSLTGTDLLRMFCEAAGGFGKINRDGLFEVIHLIERGVFPEDSQGESGNLYPEDSKGTDGNLYPEDYFEYIGASDEENTYPEYRTTKYEEYDTEKITCVNIRGTENDVGVTAGDDVTNPLVISGNIILFDTDTARAAAGNILSAVKGLIYRPNTTSLEGLPYLESGDIFALQKENDSIESYIFSRTLKGIQAMQDEYVAKGNKVRANEVSKESETYRIQGKTFEINKSIDGLTADLTNFETDTTTHFEITDGNIKSEITRSTIAEKELSSRIEQSESEIVLKVDSSGNIVNVSLGADPDDAKTYFKVEADNIDLSANDVFNIMSGGTLNLTGKDITIESENFNVDSDGKVTANDLELLGGTISIGTVRKDGNTEDRFSVDENGNVNINGGTIDIGHISATGEINSRFSVDEDGNVTISSGNISLEALDSGTLNLTGENIRIESTNFSVDEDGKVTAKAIDITGGSVEVSTNSASMDYISMIGVAGLDKIKAKPPGGMGLMDIEFAGDGDPDDSIGKSGDLYYDIDSRDLFYKISESWSGSYSFQIADDYQKYEDDVYITNTTLSTDEGLVVKKYNYQNTRYGGYTEIESSTKLDCDGVTFTMAASLPAGMENKSGLLQPVLYQYTDYGSDGFPTDYEMAIISDVPIVGKKMVVGTTPWESLYESAELTVIPGDSSDTKGILDIENVQENGLAVNGIVQVFGSVVLIYRMDEGIYDPNPTGFQISIPDVVTDRPVYVCNGDGDANPTARVVDVVLFPSEEIAKVSTSVSQSGPTRYNYFYWKKIK